MSLRGAGVLCACAVALGGGASARAGTFENELGQRSARLAREGGRPQAVVPLLGLLDLWELVGDRGAIEQLLDQVSATPPGRASRGAGSAVRADVRARAQLQRAILLERAGKHEEAEKLRRALGVLTGFVAVGPFDNEGKAGHETVFGPEKDLTARIDLASTFDGKERRVVWRTLPPQIAVDGVVGLDCCLRPETNVTGYATVAVKVPRAQAAAVRLGSTGAVKVWVNGQRVLEHDVYRPLRLDQDVGVAWLDAGWNRVTVKLSAAEQGGFGLLLRLTRPDGSPLEGLESSTALADLNAAHPAAAHPKLPAPSDLGRELRQATVARPRDAQAWTDWGLWLHHVQPEDPEKHLAVEALQQAARLQPTAEALLRLALAESDPNDQRRDLERALQAAEAEEQKQKQATGDGRRATGDEHDRSGRKAAILSALAELAQQAKRERRAEAYWLRALEADASYWPARVRLAELAAERGLPARAAAELHALEQSVPGPPLKLLRAEAQLELRRGRRKEAEALALRIREIDREDADVLHRLFGFQRAKGLVKEALALNGELLALRPDLFSAALDRAELLDGAGRLEEAHQALEAALGIVPDEPRLLERDGRLLHRLGREQPALERLRRALELRPQNPELRAYLAELEARLQPKEAGARADLARAWARDVNELMKAAPKADPKSGEPARVLYDGTVTRVHPNGLSETYQQRVIEVLDDRGARDEGDFDIRYTPDTQSLELRAARVYRPNGEVLEAISTEEADASEPWYGLYYDVRAQVIRFSALKPGDVIDLEYVLSDVGRRNIFADYFGDLHFLQEELPRLESRYVLIAPASRTLYFNEPRLPGKDALERTVETAGDERVYSIRARNVPKLAVEPGMPGFSSVAAYVHVSTYKTWEAVAQWYTGLLKGQLDANPAIQRAVKDAIAGLTDERAKIRAIYDLVVKKTRYVGLEFGIHGYQPYRVSQVFARKFGDCKDKASLLVVMLREAGIPATLVLARTRQGGDLDPSPASLAPFDHAIAYVPRYDLYLDGTAEFSGADELPAQDQDIPVLRVNEGKLVRTPVLDAARNLVTTEWQVQLDPSGAARVVEHETVAGQAAHEWRNHYQAQGEQREKYEQAWNVKHPGAQLESLDMSLDDLEKPVDVHDSVIVPHWARPDVSAEARSGALAMPALGREADMLRSYARLSERRHDLVLGYPWRQDERVTVKLPPGFHVTRLPEARVVEAPFGRFTLAVSEKAGEVTVRGQLEVARHRIAQGDYAAFRRFCADVDAAVGQDLVVAREGN